MGCCSSDDSLADKALPNTEIPETLQHNIDPEWIKISSFPLNCDRSNTVVLNDREYITAPQNDEKFQSDGIYKYNYHSDEWSVFIRYPDTTTIIVRSSAVICLNESKTEICLFCHQFISFIDIRTQTFKTYAVNDIFCDQKEIDIFYIDDKYHFVSIGTHAVWDKRDKKLKPVHFLMTFIQKNVNIQMIHKKTKRKALLLSSIIAKIKSTMADIYDIKENKWALATLHGIMLCIMADYHVGYSSMITNDHKHMIIIGGTDNNCDCDIIRIIDTDTMEVKWSVLVSPFKGPCCAIIVSHNGEVICGGYVRKHFIDLIPMTTGIGIAIIDRISNFYGSEEFIHLFSRKEQYKPFGNWKINISDVLKEQRTPKMC